MQIEQLRALAAVVDEGTFEAAARALNVTASAVSQRIKALETSVGQVVVQRSVPARPTAAGTVLLRAGRQFDLVEADARDALSAQAHVHEVSVAVNADSLATWFRPVFDDVARWADTALRVHVEDQDHSAQLLRSGQVLGAVTSLPRAVSGCRIEPLGAMTYVPAAAPSLIARFGSDWSELPVVVFNAKDDLQQRVLDRHGVTVSPPISLVPTSHGFRDAVLAGLGWGAVPRLQLGTLLEDGRLVQLDDEFAVDLHWQAWRLDSPRLARLSSSIRAAAARRLAR